MRGRAQHALGAVALHRPTDPTRCDDREPRREIVVAVADVEHERRTGSTTSAPEDGADIGAPSETLVTHDPGSRQADSFERPLRRRFFTIRRPWRVFMRARKPCFFARRRLFGW